jgi:hypothetical protein
MACSLTAIICLPRSPRKPFIVMFQDTETGAGKVTSWGNWFARLIGVAFSNCNTLLHKDL